MDNKSKTEMLYLNEIRNEVTKPLTASTPNLAVPALPNVHVPRIDLIASDSETDDEKPPIGFHDTNGPNHMPNHMPDHTPDHTLGLTYHPSDSRFASNLTLSVPDMNVYQHKKTLAQGMMDLALLSANANQMRFILQTDGRHPYFYPSLTMIGMSLLMQIAVGIGLIWNSVYNVKKDEQLCKANKANNWTVIGIFLVTILNVFISSFNVIDEVAEPPVAT